MVKTKIEYLGDLQCEAEHGPSKSTLATDAPLDNNGKARSFSPTDLVGVAMGTCMLTIMGILAEREGIDLSGTTATVTKEMAAAPARRIAKLTVQFHVPRAMTPENQTRLRNAALTCPVHKSMHPDVEIAVDFHFGEDAAIL